MQSLIAPKITFEQAIKLLKSGLERGVIQRYLREAFRNPDNIFVMCKVLYPHAFTKPFADCHREVIEEFIQPKNCAVALPRSFGKSTLLGLGLQTYYTINQLKEYIIYTSENNMKSISFLEPVRYEFGTNPMIKFLYPELSVRGVMLEGVNRQDMVDIGKTRIHALSFEKNIRGLKKGVRRPDLVFLDDIENDERVLNPDLRHKDSNKLNKQIIPAMDPEHGEFKMLGTILHLDSLLKQKIDLLGGRIYKAAEMLRAPVGDRGVITDVGEWSHILWNDMWNAERLADKYFQIGPTAFESEYMNNPIDDTTAIIKRVWIEDSFDRSISFWDAVNGDLIIGADFAFSERDVADKSAFVGVVKHGDGYNIRFCVVERGLSATPQMNIIDKLCKMEGAVDTALEENSIRNISSELYNEYQFPHTLFWTAASDPSPEAIEKRKQENIRSGKKRVTVGRRAMIERLATQFFQGRIRIPYKTAEDQVIAHQIMDELVTFSRKNGQLVETGVHSDIGIALALAIERHEIGHVKANWGFA